MRRQYWVKASILLVALALISCQSTDTMERIRELEKLKGNARIEAYGKEIERSPAPELLYNKAYHELESGDTESAIATATAALEEDPGFLRMRFLLLLSQREAGNDEGYLETLEEIAREIPHDREIINLLLEEYRLGRDYRKMTETARWLLALDPKNTKALKALSYESDYMKDISGFFDLEKVIGELPDLDITSHAGGDTVNDFIRERYILPFLFH